jgi:formylglycine-generating enzyme required for sulfatase activity
MSRNFAPSARAIPSPPSLVTLPPTPMMMRGGSWFDRWQESRATKRGRFLPGSRASNIGFRLAADGGPVR